MKILIVNDDGWETRGILELAKALRERGHEPIVFAPAENVSGQGTSMNLLPTVMIDVHEKEGIPMFAVHGTTIDCVMIGTAYAPDVDMVISGINYGLNTGGDILTSGTVAGAQDAIRRDYPSVAVSINSYAPQHLPEVARYFCDLLENKLKDVISNKYALNINIPDLPVNEIKGIVVAPISEKRWLKDITFELNGDKMKAKFRGYKPDISGERDTDVNYINQNYITISPILVNYNDYNLIQNISRALNPRERERV